jgi:hypothetical protein
VSKKSKRFSIKFLLGLTGLCAILLGIWKAYIYEPPTHKIALYEKALSTRGAAFEIPPNTISIKSVARNRHGGSIDVESGNGKSLAGTVPGTASMSACAAWLDVVQIELDPGPDRFEMIDVRIFEHESRALLSQIDPAYGWQVLQPNLLQIYGLGKQVPPLLGVWLRVHSYASGDHVAVLAPTSGASAAIPGGEIMLKEIQAGFFGWTSGAGFLPPSVDGRGGSALLLDWTGRWQDEKYQIAAVSMDGETEFRDVWLPLDSPSTSAGPVLLSMPLDEIDHLELRPFGGRHRFFFEAVELPANSGRSFDAPPIITVPVSGKSADVILSELAPLHVRLTVAAGDTISGSTANESISRMIHRPEPTDTDQSFTFAYQVREIAALPMSFRFAEVQNGNYVSSRAYGSAGGCGASGTSHGT